MLRLSTTLCLLLIPIVVSAQGYLPESDNALLTVKPAVQVKAYAFNLTDVRLLPGGPFKNAMDKDATYLLTIEPDRLLHRFHANAGLPTKGEVYGGWESAGLSGHTLGHFLSACAMMYASTGNAGFKEKTDYIIDELERCQQARKTGYVGAIPKEDSIFWKLQHGIISTSGFDMNGGWSPWYTVHKVMAGLADTYIHTGNKKALTILTGMADWTGDILAKLDDEQLEKMRKCEYGGMNDILVHLYEINGNKKYLDLSYKFHDHFVLDELAKRIDPMPGKHSNTNVPKAIGCARRYTLTSDEKDKTIATYFWESMVNHHTYVIGGNSNYEYCGDPDKLNDRLSDNTCETCNTYNMLKLTRFLFQWNPISTYGDYYERALYNHILASQNPTSGMMCYFIPLRMGTQKEFSNPFNTFTCCVGSGMENHAKYTEGIYYAGSDGSLIVNLFVSSQLNWKSMGVTLRQETILPENPKINFTLQTKSAKKFALKIRKPKWSGPITVLINGKATTTETDASGFLVINRTWKDKDKLEVNMPMNLYTESMPDNANRIAILYGPVVLAGQLGTVMPDPVFGTTVLQTNNHNVNDWLKPVGTTPLTFQTQSIAKPADVKLIPFYKTVDEFYNVYWDYYTQGDWDARQAEYLEEKKRMAEVESKTIDWVNIGDEKAEKDHNLKASDRSYRSEALGRTGREARTGGFFEFDLKVDSANNNTLHCSYLGDDRNRAFDFLVNGSKIATQELNGSTTGRFFDVEYAIPKELTADKTNVVVRVQAHSGKTAGRVFGCRSLRK